VDAVTGQIYSYTMMQRIGPEQEKQTEEKTGKLITRKQAEKLAMNTVIALVPDATEQFRLANVIEVDDARTFMFQRYLNGIPVKDDTAQVQVLNDGTVNEFYTRIAATPEQLPADDKPAISYEEAKALYLEEFKLILAYSRYGGYGLNNGQVIPVGVNLAYMPTRDENSIYGTYEVLDANTGEWKLQYGETGAASKTEPTDISGHVAEDALRNMTQHGVLLADEQGRVFPDRVITRGDWFNYLARAINPNMDLYYSGDGDDKLYADVTPDSPYYKAIKVLIDQRWLAGADPEQNLNPQEEMTREELAVLLVRILRYEKLAGFYTLPSDLPNIADASAISSKGAVSLSLKLGLLPSIEGRFMPARKVTVAEASQNDARAFCDTIRRENFAKKGGFLSWRYHVRLIWINCSNVSAEVHVTLSYRETKEQTDYVNRKVTNVLKEIIKPGMTDHEKVKVIHDWIVLNLSYDTSLKKYTAYDGLVTGRIDNRIVEGTAGGQLHAWNIVNLDGKWYHMDTTWDDPTPDRKGKSKYPAAPAPYREALLKLVKAGDSKKAAYQKLYHALDYSLYDEQDAVKGHAALKTKVQGTLKEGGTSLTFRYKGTEAGLIEDLQDLYQLGMKSISYYVSKMEAVEDGSAGSGEVKEDPAIPEEDKDVSTPEDQEDNTMHLLGAAAGPVITEQLITSVQMYNQAPQDNGNGTIDIKGDKIEDIRPSIQDEVAVVFTWGLANDTHNYSDGSTFTFNLPDKFIIGSQLKGDLDGGVGEYVVNPDGTIIFTFNELIEHAQLEGNFYVWIKFDESKMEDGLKQQIDFSSVGQGSINVHFANTAVDKLKKSGSANKDNFNSDEIKWTVDFNQGEKALKNAFLTDTLPTNLELKGNIEIRELEVQLNGSVKEGPIVQTEPQFPIVLGDTDKAYRVTYTTSVKAPTTAPFTNVEFQNQVALTTDQSEHNETDIGRVRVSFNEPLNKSGQDSAYDPVTQTITWKVQYNYNQQEIMQANAWIEDRFDTAKQQLINNSVNVYQVDINASGAASNRTLVNPNEYTLETINTGFDDGFRLHFKNDITKAYEIEYDTQSIHRVYTNDTITNTVNMYDNTSKTGRKDIREVIFAKSVKSENFNTKEIEWQMVLNRDLQDMTDIVITDNYEGRHMKLIPGSLQVTGVNKDDFELTPDPADPTYEKGFSVRLKDGVTINTEHVITYTTSFDPTAGMPTDNEYRNSAKVDWKESNVAQTAITKSAMVKPQEYTIQNGNKKGEYSAKDKTITWTIDVNYNLFDIQEAILKDAYTELQGANNVTAVGSEVPLTPGQFQLNPDGKGFTLDLGNIGKAAYRIQYQTSLDGPYSVEGTYANQAVLTDGYMVDPEYGSASGKTIEFKDADIAFDIENKKIRQGFELTKVDAIESSKKLQGATFELYLNNGATREKIDELTTGEDGKIAKGDLLPGDYELVEVVAPEFYQLDATPIPFTIVENQTQIITLTKSNAIGAGGKLVVTKVNAKDQSVLSGIEFELRDHSNAIIDTKVTDLNGVIEFDGLTYGSYTLVETKAEGFVIEQPETLVSIIKPETQLTIENKENNRSVKLIKTNAGRTQHLQGAVFELRAQTALMDANGNWEFHKVTGLDEATLTTNQQGEIVLKDLDVNKYQLVEIKAPNGYILDTTPVPFEITNIQTEAIVVEKTNQAIPVSGGGSSGPYNPGTPTTGVTPDPEKPVQWLLDLLNLETEPSFQQMKITE
ncbi:hypothetical protein HK101_006474, partial [Irineochytrium annulatum]